MGYYYLITGNVDYTLNKLADSDAKVVWERVEGTLVFKKKLSGKFVLQRAGNETIYDIIMAMTMCGYMNFGVYDTVTNNPIVLAIFSKRDIEYNEDKCQITISPQYYDPVENCLLNNQDKPYNIINSVIAPQQFTIRASNTFEYAICTEDSVLMRWMEWNGSRWTNHCPQTHYPEYCVYDCLGVLGGWDIHNSVSPRNNEQGWSFFSQKDIITGGNNATGWLATVTTTWFREVQYTPVADEETPTAPPLGGSTAEWIYLDMVTINGYDLHKWGRPVNASVLNYNNIPLPPDFKIENLVNWELTSYYDSGTARTITRGRKLTDVLSNIARQCGYILVSDFFYNSVNPVSGVDLSNLIMVQKSDMIFTDGNPPSDNATKGFITFKQLMEHLYSMFQVKWIVRGNQLVVEHVSWFRNNGSYTVTNSVDIDLTAVYPVCLSGSNAYSYEAEMPIREQFKFMEAWNIDFIGTDIEYDNCVTNGNTDVYGAELFTTDLDFTFIDTDASKEGFVVVHCDPSNVVYREVGKLSGIESNNAHLSWANLQHYYWQQNRPLPTGRMNNQLTDFTMNRKLRKQVPITFPYCLADFDPTYLIRTTQGDGEVESAEYSFKTGQVKVQLSYE